MRVALSFQVRGRQVVNAVYALRHKSATHVTARLRQSYQHFVGNLRTRSKNKFELVASTPLTVSGTRLLDTAGNVTHPKLL